MNRLEFKIVNERATLEGFSDDLQKVATVYAGRNGEFRVYAPSQARGSALEWADHFCVRAPDEGGEIGVPEQLAAIIVSLVEQQLKIEDEPTSDRKKLLESAILISKDLLLEFLAKYCAEMSRQ